MSEQAVHKAPGGWFVAFGQAARPNEQTSHWLVCEAVRVAAGYAGQFLQNEESVSDSYALPLPSLITRTLTQELVSNTHLIGFLTWGRKFY